MRYLFLVVFLVLVGCSQTTNSPIITEKIAQAPMNIERQEPKIRLESRRSIPQNAPSAPSTSTKKDIENSKKEIERNKMMKMQPPTAGISLNNQNKIESKKITSADNIMNQLSMASMAFGVPEKANIKDKIRIQFLINPSINPNILEKSITINGKIISSSILISKIIDVELIAAGLEIKELSPSRQAVSNTETTIWEWELIPTKAGEFDLYLIVNAEVEVDSTRAHRRLKTYEKQLKIEITPQQQFFGLFEKYWQWVWTAIFAPLIVWGWTSWRKKRKSLKS